MLRVTSQYQRDFTDANVRRAASGFMAIRSLANKAMEKMDQLQAENPNITMAELSELLSYELGQIEMMVGRLTPL